MRYISLLRGINVSGQKKVKMSELQSVYEQLGFDNVLTYIQSGNVIFTAKNKNISTLIHDIESAIKKYFNFRVPVVIRTHAELKKIINGCPFNVVSDENFWTKILVTFLSAKPDVESVSGLMKYVYAPEELVVKGREVYLYCPNGYGKSKLSNTFLEKKLAVGATSRNWKSVNALFQLAHKRP